MAGPRYLAGVELGGTKSMAVLAREAEIVEQAVVPSRGPEETLADIAQRLREWGGEHDLAALGIASFGPVQLDPAAPGYGRMHATPKPGWTGAAVAETLTRGLDCPWTIDTDVNGAALAEYLWGAGRGATSVCYVTIGTGVGGGLVIEGRPVHGAMHPEIGHLSLRRAPDDGFAGACPFHGDCIEGLVAGPALAARFGGTPAQVPDDDPRWLQVASDLAELAGAILLTTSAQRILIGGGVGLAKVALLDAVRTRLVERMGGYLPFLDRESARSIVRPPELGDRAGPLGSIALALIALNCGEGGRRHS
jgi:fructokinase